MPTRALWPKKNNVIKRKILRKIQFWKIKSYTEINILYTQWWFMKMCIICYDVLIMCGNMTWLEVLVIFGRMTCWNFLIMFGNMTWIEIILVIFGRIPCWNFLITVCLVIWPDLKSLLFLVEWPAEIFLLCLVIWPDLKSLLFLVEWLAEILLFYVWDEALQKCPCHVWYGDLLWCFVRVWYYGLLT